MSTFTPKTKPESKAAATALVASGGTPGQPLQMRSMGDEGAGQYAPGVLQRRSASPLPPVAVNERPPAETIHRTGLPDALKHGVEALSGVSLYGVRVHYNSPKPAQMDALAYAQGREIYLGHGQERHLPHEAWHAAQQLQGRVAPTRKFQGMALNDSRVLEREADVMGVRAASYSGPMPAIHPSGSPPGNQRAVAQCLFNALSDDDIELAKRYVAVIRPDLLDEFERIENDDSGYTDLYAWLPERLGVYFPDVRDWERSFVRSRPLVIDNEEVRGSRDLPSDSEEELEEFRIGLDEAEYSPGQLKRLHRALLKRDAPHDKRRRELVLNHNYHRSTQFEERDNELEDSDESSGSSSSSSSDDDGYESPDFSESDEGSGTDTEHSDSEDEVGFSESKKRLRTTRLRLKREEKLLKPNLVRQRLKQLVKVLDSDDSSSRKRKRSNKKKVSKQESIRKAIFEKGVRPHQVYRKTPKFRHPSVKVSDRALLPTAATEQEIQDVAQLNVLLELGVPIATAERLVSSRFVVAQYRGLFYSRNTFDKRKRKRHRGLDERNRPVFSTSALESGSLGIGGYYYLYGSPEQQGALNAYQGLVTTEAERIRQALLELRKVKPQESTRQEVGRATDRFKPSSLSDIGTHFYSQNYDGYHEALGDFISRDDTSSPNPLDSLFKGLTSGGNPKVSTGDVPTHAARYAYGLKPYGGHEHEILEPEYDESGKPKHPYSGRIYVSLHPLTDFDEGGPEQLVELQRQQRINIAQVILPERETPFEGYLGPGRVKHQVGAKFPNFARGYKKVYAEKYGLTKELFEQFRQALRRSSPGTDERVFVEALLSNYLAMHAEIRAIEQAETIAREQGAKLLYRTGPQSFGFAPSPLKGTGKALPELSSIFGTLLGSKMTVQQGSSSVSGEVIRISGSGFACYIRSLVTAAVWLYQLPQDGDIEELVDTVQDHLSHVGLRDEGEDIDAGGLVAAEVRRVLHELLGGFDPEIHIITETDGATTEYLANTGAQPVYLRYTPGHFDLINRR